MTANLPSGLTKMEEYLLPPDSADYDMMHAQLQDAAERYCQKQAKVCLNDLERRLLQRQQVPSFLTFLVAVILLNCVERMTALYYSFDPHAPSSAGSRPCSEPESSSVQPQDVGDMTNTHQGSSLPHLKKTSRQESDRTALPPDWPIAESPSLLWPQGFKFASLLQLLLRMRGLPPAIHIRDDGKLAILSSFNKAHPVEVTSSTEGGDSQQVLAALWIERTGLVASHLWRANDMTDLEAGREAWGGTLENGEKDGVEGQQVEGAQNEEDEGKNDDEGKKNDEDNNPEENNPTENGKSDEKNESDRMAQRGVGVGIGIGARAWDLRFIASLLLPVGTQ